MENNNNNVIFKIKELRMVGLWSWDSKFDSCAICKKSTMDKCIECDGNNNGGKCTIMWGICNHVYHAHCMSGWTKNRNVCPLCNSEWEILRVE
jgi:RING-box protein 1